MKCNYFLKKRMMKLFLKKEIDEIIS